MTPLLEGAADYFFGRPGDLNPYGADSEAGVAWQEGWEGARRFDQHRGVSERRRWMHRNLDAQRGWRIPTLGAARIERRGTDTLVVWCEWCEAMHEHGVATGERGLDQGHRHAHCTNPESPYHLTGYNLRQIAKTRLVGPPAIDKHSKEGQG